MRGRARGRSVMFSPSAKASAATDRSTAAASAPRGGTSSEVTTNARAARRAANPPRAPSRRQHPGGEAVPRAQREAGVDVGRGRARARPARCGRWRRARASPRASRSARRCTSAIRRRTGSRRPPAAAGRRASARARTAAGRRSTRRGGAPPTGSSRSCPAPGRGRAPARRDGWRSGRAPRPAGTGAGPRGTPPACRAGGRSRPSSSGRAPSTAASSARSAAHAGGFCASRYHAHVSAWAVVSWPASISVIASSRISASASVRAPSPSRRPSSTPTRSGRPLGGRLVLGHQAVEEPVDVALGRVELPRRRQRQPPQELGAGQEEAVEHAHARVEHGRDLGRLGLDVGVEDRAADDPQRHPGHLAVDVDGGALVPVGRHVLGGVDHDVAVAVDVLAAEDRLDQPPAAQVVRPLAREQAVAEQAPGRLQRPALHERRAVVDEHAADELGVAHEEEAVAAREAHEHDVRRGRPRSRPSCRADRAGSGRSSPRPGRRGPGGRARRPACGEALGVSRASPEIMRAV